MAEHGRGNLDQRLLSNLLAVGPVAVRSDAELVERFLTGHGEAAEAAFGALVERHGPAVLAQSRRIVRDDHTAEDVFQAVFLILARRARSVQVDDSLGRWLHGVTRRVAVRARHQSRREIPPPAAPDRQPTDPALAADRDEIRHLVAVEVANLSSKYREPVRLFHLDGLGQDQVAEALGIPVGTVRSRLSRARNLLRTQLSRRGVSPTALATWFGTRPSLVHTPAALVRTTLANLGSGPLGAASAPVLLLVHHTMRHFLMTKLIGFGLLAVAFGSLTTGMIVLAGGDEPKAPAPVAAQAPSPVAVQTPARVAPPAESLEAQFRRIAAEFQAAREFSWAEGKKAKDKFEESKIVNKLAPNIEGYSRRIIDLAAAHLLEPGARDALIWVIHQPQQSDGGDYGDDFARAVRLLVWHYADDPEVARAALGLERVIGERRDIFINGIYANAQNREAKGLIRLARADYLITQAGFSASARKFPSRLVVTYQGYDDQGKRVEMRNNGSNEDEGYRVYLRMLDPDFVRKEGERLYEEVIAEYADIPYITLGTREMERKAREHPSATITDPAKKQDAIENETYLARPKWTLGQMAAKKLDELRNLAVGKVAPDFTGSGADGKPIKLSDYRGQVVALVYWFSTCGPCLSEIPHEKELAAKLKGRPFTWLGIVTDGKGEDARKILDSEGITWPNILAGGDKVAEQYHVKSNPDYFIIDAAGVIRWKGQISASSRDEFIEKLVKEAESRATPRP